jgi:hypothetical protein
LQPMNADTTMNSTFRGIQIDFSEQYKKHKSSIRVRRDLFSNVSDSSFDSEQHTFGRISTFRGMQMRVS